MENSTWRIVQKIYIRQIEQMGQIDKRPPGSQNVMKYCVANEMQMADRKLYLADRPKNLYSPNRTN